MALYQKWERSAYMPILFQSKALSYASKMVYERDYLAKPLVSKEHKI